MPTDTGWPVKPRLPHLSDLVKAGFGKPDQSYHKATFETTYIIILKTRFSEPDLSQLIIKKEDYFFEVHQYARTFFNEPFYM